MNQVFNKDDVKGYECRFAVHCPRPHGYDDDIHLVKEVVHLKDGTSFPNVRILKNYKREFFVTNKGRRNHLQKKEWEERENLDRFTSTQSDLSFNIARVLGKTGGRTDLRTLGASAYLYGSDILSTALIKRDYMEKYPDLQTFYKMAVFDTETDVVYGTEQIIMATISFKDRVFTAVTKGFLNGISDPEDTAKEAFVRYLGSMEQIKKDGSTAYRDIIKERNLNWELMIVDAEIDTVIQTIKKAHEWRPDWLAIWNLDFDVSKIIAACERAGVDPATIFSDPLVPEPYRFFNYVRGPEQKVTASGKVTPIKPADRWHTVYCPSSFYLIDAMCVYRKIRQANGEERSYALDAILDKILGMRKLKFEKANHVRGLKWHQLMQTQYKIEYVIYNVFDCISMELLDEVTLDLAIAMPSASGCSDFQHFKSQPRRLVNDMDSHFRNQNRIIGTTGETLHDPELQPLCLGLEGWIVTLPAALVADNGLCILEDYPTLRSNARGHVGDLDVSASYPHGEMVFNISKATTKKELCKIEGVTEHTQRMQTINLSGGRTNSVEIASTLLKMPTLQQLLDAFKEEINPALPEDVAEVELKAMQGLWIPSSETIPESRVVNLDI